LTCLGQRYLLELQEIVGNKDLNMCLLTHVHFDHCGAISVFKNAFPKIEVWGSEPSKEILERLRAIQLIMKRKTSKNSKKNARLAIHHLICFLLRWWLNFNHRHS
jgi:glyoxylase-like metal-dependent hydrolase (beta-lactamase superfamily II)